MIEWYSNLVLFSPWLYTHLDLDFLGSLFCYVGGVILVKSWYMLPDFFGNSLSQRRGEKPAVMERRGASCKYGHIGAHPQSLLRGIHSVSLSCLHKKDHSCITNENKTTERRSNLGSSACLPILKVQYSTIWKWSLMVYSGAVTPPLKSTTVDYPMWLLNRNVVMSRQHSRLRN